jgi:hypothetical protein
MTIKKFTTIGGQQGLPPQQKLPGLSPAQDPPPSREHVEYYYDTLHFAEIGRTFAMPRQRSAGEARAVADVIRNLISDRLGDRSAEFRRLLQKTLPFELYEALEKVGTAMQGGRAQPAEHGAKPPSGAPQVDNLVPSNPALAKKPESK